MLSSLRPPPSLALRSPSARPPLALRSPSASSRPPPFRFSTISLHTPGAKQPRVSCRPQPLRPGSPVRCPTAPARRCCTEVRLISVRLSGRNYRANPKNDGIKIGAVARPSARWFADSPSRSLARRFRLFGRSRGGGARRGHVKGNACFVRVRKTSGRGIPRALICNPTCAARNRVVKYARKL